MLAEFPYLGPPHNSRRRSIGVVLGACQRPRISSNFEEQPMSEQQDLGVIRFGSLWLETQLPLRDFRNLSRCTIFCGGLWYGHSTTGQKPPPFTPRRGREKQHPTEY